MNRARVALALASVSIVTYQHPAYGDIDVSPDDYAPAVTIRATDDDPSRRESSSTSNNKTKIKARFKCEQRPGARAAGLGCQVTDFPGTYSPPPSEGGSSPADFERAIREVPMPALRLEVQPRGGTLVNVETIFYTSPRILRRTVTLLGSSVRLEATPVRFTWVHGDGTSHATSRPGRPYPAKDVTYRYRQPAEDVRARVDTSYRVRYSVDGGDWATLDETLTAAGPGTSFDVDEAAPVLTD